MKISVKQKMPQWPNLPIIQPFEKEDFPKSPHHSMVHGLSFHPNFSTLSNTRCHKVHILLLFVLFYFVYLWTEKVP